MLASLHLRWMSVFVGGLLAACTVFAQQIAPQITFTPSKSSAVYQVGEKIGWEVKTVEGQSFGAVTYTLKKNGLTTYKTDTIDLSSGRATIETSLDEPGAVFLEVQLPPAAGAPPGRGGGNARDLRRAGALVEPQKLQPSQSRPADFDTWWDAKIKQLHAVPINAQLTPADGGKEGIDYSLVTMDNINATRIHGQFAKPQRAGKFPALLVLQWAGVYPLQKQWVTDRAALGYIVLNIEPHDLPGDEPAAFYAGKLPNYQAMGQDDREQSYFLRMYLSAYRAVDYLASREDWDGKTLVVMGTSMGGQQTLATAGLHPKVTALLACVPSSCDAAGPLHGRAAGFPDWARSAQTKNEPKIVETAQYFDPVNFAPRIKVPALVAMGFIDETCPPVGVWSAINQLKGPKEPLPLITSGHQDVNGSQKPYQTRSVEWLTLLAKGERLTLP